MTQPLVPSAQPPEPRTTVFADTKRSTWAGALLGIGVIAALDELIFHQILGWHHFYDRSTPAVGLLSDGFLHAAELILLVAGFFLALGLQRRRQLSSRHAWAGFFLGLGGFQLFDGLINHKVLRIHQIRYDVDLLPYDLIWNVFAATILLVGLALWRRARSLDARHRAEPAP